jgi:FixJ family two-component response regulator
MSGIEVMKTIKEKSRDTVIVIVTGYADDPIALKAMAQGPLLLVRKPFRENDIIEVLNMVVRGTALR